MKSKILISIYIILSVLITACSDSAVITEGTNQSSSKEGESVDPPQSQDPADPPPQTQPPQTQPPQTQPPANTQYYGMTQMEIATLDAINEERRKMNIAPLAPLKECVEAAQFHANDMNTRNYFSHDGLDESWSQRMSRFGLSRYYVGENIAWNRQGIASTVNAWMNSAGHRKNILDSSYKSTGIGYVNGYYVQCFASKAP